jgi:hypothetical protein
MNALLLAALLQQAAPDKPEIDEKAGTVAFPAVALKTEVYADLKGVIEYVVVNKGGKSYEALFEANVDALAVHAGLRTIGVAPGQPAREEDGRKRLPEGGQVRLFVEWTAGAEKKRAPAESFVLDTTTGKPMTAGAWFFTGSKKGFVPELERQELLVLITKNLVGLHHNDPTTLLTNPASSPVAHRYKAVPEALLKEGTPVRLVLEAVR